MSPIARVALAVTLVSLVTTVPAMADDLRRSHVWTVSQSDGREPPKLGLQARNPERRSMSFERFFMTCRKAGGVEMVAWPVDLRAKDPEPGIDANFITDNTGHTMPNWRRSFNEMDDVTQVSVVSRDLGPVRDMLGAGSIRYGVEGVAMALPKASPAVRAFLAECSRWSGRR
ncbi:hypothetical protein [Methylobacterium brachiatum]